jgi:hypothetical protein
MQPRAPNRSTLGSEVVGASFALESWADDSLINLLDGKLVRERQACNRVYKETSDDSE